jgi:streptogramin lyase
MRDRTSEIVTKLQYSWADESRRRPASLNQSAGQRRCLSNRPFLEVLESRRLLSATVTEYPALYSGTNGNPSQLAVGSDGNLWFTEPTADALGAFNPTSTAVSSQITLSAFGGNPPAITATSGANGAIWFALANFGELGQINLSTQVPMIYTASLAEFSAGITSLGNDLWFTIPGANSIGEFDAGTDEFVNFYSVSPANIDVSGFSSQIIAGPDGNLWFTEPGAIGIFSPKSDSVITQVALPTANGTEMPSALTIGPDGNIWFTESTATSSAVGVIKTTSETYITQFALPAASQPQGITSGPDNNIWFSESGTGAIGMIAVTSITDPALDTLGTPISIPTLGSTGGVVSHPDPLGITAGPDGNLWFADSAGAIGMVTLNAAPHFAVTSAPPSSITAGTSFGLTVAAEYSPTVPLGGFDGNVTATIYNSSNVSEGSQTVTAANGVATFSNDLTLDTADSGYTIVVTSSASNAPTSLTTGSFVVVAAAPTKLVFTTPPQGTVTAGGSFGLTAELEDSFNNIATNYSGTVTAAFANNPGGSTLGGTTSVNVSPTDANPGFATFTNLALFKAGNDYTLKISTPGVSATTAGINVIAAAPSQLVIISSPSGTFLVGSGFSVTVVAEDQFNNLVSSDNGAVMVAVAANPGGSGLSGPVSENLTAGTATFNGLSLNNPGNGYTLSLSGSGLSSATTSAFNVAQQPTVSSVAAVYTLIKKGKVTKKVLSGYTITFSTAMNQGTINSSGDFVLDTAVPTKKTKKMPATIKLVPVRFSVQNVTSTSVTISPVGTPFKTKAGKITFPQASAIQSSAGFGLNFNGSLAISKGGKFISVSGSP